MFVSVYISSLVSVLLCWFSLMLQLSLVVVFSPVNKFYFILFFVFLHIPHLAKAWHKNQPQKGLWRSLLHFPPLPKKGFLFLDYSFHFYHLAQQTTFDDETFKSFFGSGHTTTPSRPPRHQRIHMASMQESDQMCEPAKTMFEGELVELETDKDLIDWESEVVHPN